MWRKRTGTSGSIRHSWKISKERMCLRCQRDETLSSFSSLSSRRLVRRIPVRSRRRKIWQTIERQGIPVRMPIRKSLVRMRIVQETDGRIAVRGVMETKTCVQTRMKVTVRNQTKMQRMGKEKTQGPMGRRNRVPVSVLEILRVWTEEKEVHGMVQVDLRTVDLPAKLPVQGRM